MRKTYLLIVLLFALVTISSCTNRDSNGQLGVVGGTTEPDYRYPWVVNTAGTEACHGVLIDPKWVLTAAHCVETSATRVSFSRTDPDTGGVIMEKRVPVGPGLLSGVFIHPMYNTPTALDNDIALIKLARPFNIHSYLQTVGLPSSPRVAGVVGTVASSSHTEMLPPGKVAIFRAPLPQQDFPKVIHIFTSDATGALCPGDSGSGFVTYENGRATVRGIASTVNATSDCVTPSGNQADFVDVFAYRDWILQTIGMTDDVLARNTRVRRSGIRGRGFMTIFCVSSDYQPFGPLDVLGVEIGMNCEADQTQTIAHTIWCFLFADQPGPLAMQVRITGFTMKTVSANGATDVKSLPFSYNTASYSGFLPAGATREFTCQIGLADAREPGGGVFRP